LAGNIRVLAVLRKAAGQRPALPTTKKGDLASALQEPAD
jgi:CHAD domain-containing protein